VGQLNTGGAESSSKVFISHAVADKKLVDALVDLLQVGCNLSTQQIFASSIDGARPFQDHEGG
jgi:hypothetical protein